MERYQVNVRAAYADTDQMGFVHHSNYVKYLEYARWEVFRQLGIAYKKIEEDGILMPVIDMNLRFLKPLRYDDLVNIELDFSLVRPTRLEVNYRIYNQDGELVHKAYTALAFLRKSSGKPCRVPETIIEKILEVVN